MIGKKWLSLLLAALLSLSLMSGLAIAADGYTVSLSSSLAEVETGSSVTVSVDVASDTQTTYNAFYATLAYESSIFTYAGENEINGFSVNSASAGTLKISRVGENVAIGDSPDLALTFTAAAAGAGTFSLTSAKVDIAANAEKDAPSASLGEDVSVTVPGTAVEISTAAELAAFADSVKSGNTYNGATVNLTADIDMTGAEFTPIGYYDETDNTINPFSGTFDGGGHTVTLDINSPYYGHRALFGYVRNGTVKNVTVAGTVKAGGDPKTVATSAGVVATLDGGTITGCTNLAEVTGNIAGGIVGYSNTARYPVQITDCYNAGSITATGESGVGGVAGTASGMDTQNLIYLTRCGNSGAVTASNTRAGGVAGISMFSVMEECWNTGAVSGMTFIGGLVGNGNYGVTLKDCYNTGRVTSRLEASAGSGVGGLVGVTAAAVIAENVYNAGQVVGGNENTPTGALVGSGNGIFTNAYYLATTDYSACGSGTETGTPATAVTLDELKTMSTALGNKFENGAHHPVLAAQSQVSKGIMTGLVELNGTAAKGSAAGTEIALLTDAGEQTLTADLTTANGSAVAFNGVFNNALLAAINNESVVQKFAALTDAGFLTFDKTALNGILQKAGDQNVELAVEKISQSDNQSIQALIDKGQPVYRVTLTAGENDAWSGSAVLSLPFVRTSSSYTVKLSGVSEGGTITDLESGYDAAAKRVSATVSTAGFFTITETENTSGGGGSGGQGNTGSGDVNAYPWDGLSIDVSWFNKDAYDETESYYISTPAQLAGLAAIVNGIYNAEIDTFAGDMTAVVDNVEVSGDASGPQGMNKSTETYHYGSYDFNGKTVYVNGDLDMSGGNYMPIGGQYLMTKNDYDTKISASFNGTFDGGGHSITIVCDRHCSTGNYGDGASVGLIGRLGAHDGDDTSLWPTTPTVRNVAVYGSVHANRSVGGVVGKTGKTAANITGNNDDGALIECCANFATVSNTDSKGCGGIVGSGWNGGKVINCYNSGSISTTYACPTAGISGSNEIIIENCYNVGDITATAPSYAMALGTNNGGAPYSSCVINCWYLDGSAIGGGYYSGNAANNDNALSSEKMKTEEFLNTLGSAFAQDTNGINSGYPVLAWQNPSAPTGTGEGSISTTAAPQTTSSEVAASTAVSGDTATVTVRDSDLEKAAEGANKNTQLVVSADVPKDANVDTVTTQLPSDGMKTAADSGASLKVETPVGDVVFSNTALKDLTKDGGDVTVTVKENSDGSAAITVSVGGKAVEEVSGGVKVKVPADGGNVAVLIKEDGTQDIIEKSVVEDKTAYVLIDGTGTIKIIDNSRHFVDVPDNAWFKSAVDFVSSHELFIGISDTEFGPGLNMTRAMMVTVLYRLEGAPDSEGVTAFDDVKSGEWYSSAVKWANDAGIVLGYDEKTFGTNDAITREQMAVMFYRYAKYAGLDTTASKSLSSFPDGGDVSDWAQEAMSWCAAVGLFKGDDTGALRPQDNATRAEVATLFQRMVELMVK